VPQAGVQVTFATGNAGIATVAPATAVTSIAGVATATVTGVSSGNTTVSATANGVTATTPVRVPDLSAIGLLVLTLAMAATAIWRWRRAALAR
jgi:hypothetical protein